MLALRALGFAFRDPHTIPNVLTLGEIAPSYRVGVVALSLRYGFQTPRSRATAFCSAVYRSVSTGCAYPPACRRPFAGSVGLGNATARFGRMHRGGARHTLTAVSAEPTSRLTKSWLAFTLNSGFFVGDVDNPEHHNVYELFATIVVNLIATVLKFGERTQMGTVLLATSLVADLELVAAALVWAIAVHVTAAGLTPATMAVIVSLAGGALLANAISVILLVVDIALPRR